MPRIPVKLVSWEDIVNWAWKLAEKIRKDGYRPDIIVALARGGYVPARLLCDLLDVENLVSIQSQHWTEAAKREERAIIKYPYKIDLRGHKVLIVDDICDTGESLILAKNYILENWNPDEVKIATLQWISPVAKIRPDYYTVEVKDWTWFQYPWTRLEDTYEFIKRMMIETYKELGRKEWSYEEIVKGFREWYGIDVGERYYRNALKILEEKGIIKYNTATNKYILIIE